MLYLTFAGFIGMIDPPREEVAQAVEDCKKAGIKVVMITGDQALTARAIAEKTGIYKDGDLIFDGGQLETMNQTQLDDKLEKISVFARVSPEHKLKIVNAYKRKGKTQKYKKKKKKKKKPKKKKKKKKKINKKLKKL